MIIMQAIQKSRPLIPRKSQHFLAFSCHHRERNIKQNVVHANNRAAAFFSSDMKGIRMKSTTSPTDISATPSGMSRPIYVAATQQHVGKTTTCLSLISGLKKRFPQSIGYIKPVGQQHVPVYSEKMGKEIRVDKDVTLLRDFFNLEHIDYGDMSPVLIPKGYTKDYIDGKISHDGQLKAILDAYHNIAEKSEVVLCEGTGHCAVGSIVGLSNAKVASLIGADMVLVANGGLGSCFDQLELNRVLCEHHNVNVAGVIVNKVMHDKYEQTKDYLGRAMMERWGIPLLGCVPDKPYLGHPALADLERLFRTKLISGKKHRFRHYTVNDITLVTTSLTQFLTSLREKPSRSLYLCHATREDIVLGFLAEYQRRKRIGGPPFEAALIICGREGRYEVSREVRELIEVHEEEIPIILSPYTTHHTMEHIHSFTPKLNVDDKGRAIAACDHYEKFIDYDLLLSRTGNALASTRSRSA